MRIAVLYALFALLSILVNIGTQIAWVAMFPGPGAVALSIGWGTATGLVTKYVLDKHWIFRHIARGRLHEARTFLLYTAMGGLTTAVFWGTELAFHVVFPGDGMRYLGGVLGLVVGYVMKYRLDKRYVFTQPGHA